MTKKDFRELADVLILTKPKSGEYWTYAAADQWNTDFLHIGEWLESSFPGFDLDKWRTYILCGGFYD